MYNKVSAQLTAQKSEQQVIEVMMYQNMVRASMVSNVDYDADDLMVKHVEAMFEGKNVCVLYTTSTKVDNGYELDTFFSVTE